MNGYNLTISCGSWFWITWCFPLTDNTIGIPSSGKTKRTLQLQKYFETQGKNVCVVSENEEIQKAGFDKNLFYKDSQKEKQIRGILKSEVLRLIRPTNLVILDGSNYIKGYRYELYCATKANKSTQCTIECMINIERAYELNMERPDAERYSRDVFDELCQRYESPEGKNRWDAPLFVLQQEDDLNFAPIEECLFERKPPPPNMSTQNTPLSDTNFLYELDRITNDVTQQLITGKKLRATKIKLKDHPQLSIDITDATILQLNMLRRQYIVYSKMHVPDINQILLLYVQYLKTNLNN